MPRPKFDALAFLAEASQLPDRDDQTLGYIARVFAQTGLPYRDPGDVLAWGRRNGEVSLRIEPGVVETEDGGYTSAGFPFGVLPRLTLTWLATEAVRTKERRIVLGDSLAAFLREIEQAPTGGTNGTIRRLETQLNRLLASRIRSTTEETRTGRPAHRRTSPTCGTCSGRRRTPTNIR